MNSNALTWSSFTRLSFSDHNHQYNRHGVIQSSPIPPPTLPLSLPLYNYNPGIEHHSTYFYPTDPDVPVDPVASSSTRTSPITRLAQSPSVRFPDINNNTAESNYYTLSSGTVTNAGRFSARSPLSARSSSSPAFNHRQHHLHHSPSYDHETPLTTHAPELYRPTNSNSQFSASRVPFPSGSGSSRQSGSANEHHTHHALPRWDIPLLDQADGIASATPPTAAAVPSAAPENINPSTVLSTDTYQWPDPVSSDRPSVSSSPFPRSQHKSRMTGSTASAMTSQPLSNSDPHSHPTQTMAIQTKPRPTSTSASTSSSRPNPPPVPATVPMTPAAIITALSSNEPIQSQSQPQTQSQSDKDSTSKSRKKHGCSMCHKSFDRPSTLRKHLLVHTGEKAFVCHICGRRFGVNSNLNRHVKRCILRNPDSSSPSATVTTSLLPQLTNAPVDKDNNIPSPPRLSAIAAGKRKATSSPTSSSSSKQTPTCSSAHLHPHAQAPSPHKRRRRPPSPVQWIPASLLPFNLFSIEANQAAPVPLLPVSPVRDPRTDELIEERNSWDERVGSSPYLKDWKGQLPGPGLRDPGGDGLPRGKDVRNFGVENMFGGGGYVMGRLVLS